MNIPEILSINQARKLVLHSQQLPPRKQKGRAKDATLASIEQLGYVQIDTISVIQRAHHHTLWNRNPRYQPAQLEQLLAEKKVFEYWSHAAAYLPLRDYRFSLYRKNAISSGKQNHWYRRDPKMMKYVLDRITAEGPLMAKDFEHTGETITDWTSKPAKQALEYLFMQGDLMIPCRSNFHKVYDLTERVLPPHVDNTPPTDEEYARFLIIRYLEANGVGLVREFSYLLKNIKPQLSRTLKQMLSDNELQLVRIAGEDYYMLPKSSALLGKPLSRRKLKFLSPFDNLLIQRNRVRKLFNFDYQIECYLPAHKRKFGYFVLPILWDGRLVGRMDCKADRKTLILHIYNLIFEPWVSKKETLRSALRNELKAFKSFNGSKDVVFHDVSDCTLKFSLQENF
jgi:uncharacterized protein YcaQ